MRLLPLALNWNQLVFAGIAGIGRVFRQMLHTTLYGKPRLGEVMPQTQAQSVFAAYVFSLLEHGPIDKLLVCS